MPWTGACFLIGAVAISGLPPSTGSPASGCVPGAASTGSSLATEPLVHLLFPVAAALLALTGALAAACFVKAFGITFLALPRSAPRRRAGVPGGDALAAGVARRALRVARRVSRRGARALSGDGPSLPGLQPPAEMIRGPLGMAGARDRRPVVTRRLGARASRRTRRRGASGGGVRLGPPSGACRRGGAAGCSARGPSIRDRVLEAADDDLSRRVPADAGSRGARQGLAVLPAEVRYHVEIEPTFERYVYGPLCDSVLRVADRLKILQAGSLHAYLGYVIVLVLSLVLMVWWSR